MKRSRLTDSRIMVALKQAEGGALVPDLCRKYGGVRQRSNSGVPSSGGIDVSMLA